MTVDEFEDRLLRFGGQLLEWPPDDAKAARDLLDQSARARDLLDETRRMEGLLRQGLAEEPPADLATTILDAIAPQSEQPVCVDTRPNNAHSRVLVR